MATPEFFTVIGDFKPLVADLPTDPDADPQLGSLSATVTFEPMLHKGDILLATSSTPRPIGYIPAPIVARIDLDGILKLRVDPDGIRSNHANVADFPGTGNITHVYFAQDTSTYYRWNGEGYDETYSYTPVRLLADTPLLELATSLYWKVTFTNVAYNRKPGFINGFTFEAPSGAEVLNLIDVFRQPGVLASGINKIAPGGVRVVDGNKLQFSFGGVDIPDAVDIRFTADVIEDAGATGRALVRSTNATDAWDALGTVPSGNLPSYVDDVLEFANVAAFPVTGEAGKVYLALDTTPAMSYRWSGSTYAKLGGATTAEDIANAGTAGRAVVKAANAAAVRTAAGGTATGGAVFTAADAAAVRAAAGSGTVGDVVFTAATGAAARSAIGVIAPAATATPATNLSNLTAALAANATVRTEGVYIVTPASYGVPGLVVPAGKELAVGNGSAVKLPDGALDAVTAGATRNVVSLRSGSTFRGTIDGNRDAQDETAFNAAGGLVQATGLVVNGDPTPITGITVDATIIGTAGATGYFNNVHDSHIRIRARHCGSGVIIQNCHNLVVDIEVDDLDNKNWRVWQHAVDLVGCSNISGRIVIRRQTETVPGVGFSTFGMSGLTVLDSEGLNFDLVDISCVAPAPGSTQDGPGISLLGVRRWNSAVTRVHYAGTLIELGGVVDSTFGALDVDGEYMQASAGVSLYNHAHSVPTSINGGTSEQCRNVRFMGGTIRRCGTGVRLWTASDTVWHGVSVIGNGRGLDLQYVDAVHYAPAPNLAYEVMASHRFFACDFSYNEDRGVSARSGRDVAFYGCRFNNNGQSGTQLADYRFGGTASSVSAGLLTLTGGSDMTGWQFHGCNFDDDQGWTAPAYPDPNRPTVIAVDRPERYGVGQTITIAGVGAAGAGLITRIDEITRDELFLSDAMSTFPTVAGTSGTIATTGKSVVGSGTVFLTDLIGRAYIRVGSDYRRIVSVSDDTHAIIEPAFPSNVPALTALTFSATTITTAHTQKWGIYLVPQAISPQIVACPPPTGNITGNVYDGTAVGTRALYSASLASNVASAAKLATPRAINGVAFDGTGDITVADSTKEPTIAAGTSAQYIRGDKSPAALNKSAVGLGSVDNTTDAAKSVSHAVTAGSAASAASATTAASADTAVKLTNARTIQVSLGSTTAASFDGTGNITPGVSGFLPLWRSGVYAPIAGAYVSQHYYLCNSQTLNTTSSALGNGSVRLTPWVVTEAITISKIWCEVATAGSGGSMFRLGAWNDAGGKAGTVAVDGGTVVADGSTGCAEVSVSVTLQPGVYWVGGAVQGGAATQPTIRTVTVPSNTPAVVSLGTSLPGANPICGALLYPSAFTGAFGDLTAVTPSNSSVGARIGIKVA